MKTRVTNHSWQQSSYYQSNYPAPLKLCFMPGFDLHEDPFFCPTERNALTEFYNSAQGSEWINSNNWAEPYVGHCNWYGVKCNNANKTIKLQLSSNGLSGTLTHHLAKLHSLEVLELSNNVIKVRLCYLGIQQLSNNIFQYL